MTDTLNPGYGSPFAQGARSTSPKEVMFRLRRDNPSKNKEQLMRLFKAEAVSDPELADVCIEIAAINAYTAWEKLRDRVSEESPTAMRAQVGRERQEASTREATAIVARMEQRMVLDFMMPNQKKLRDCTFGEVREFGRGFARIAAAGSPSQLVGEVLSETKAKSLMRPKRA